MRRRAKLVDVGFAAVGEKDRRVGGGEIRYLEMRFETRQNLGFDMRRRRGQKARNGPHGCLLRPAGLFQPSRPSLVPVADYFSVDHFTAPGWFGLPAAPPIRAPRGSSPES